MKHRVGDISDLYAYPTPKKPGYLTVILNAYPIVPSDGHFSEKVNYKLRMRRAFIKGTGDRFSIDTTDEISINCSFLTPADHDSSKYAAKCISSTGIEVETKYEEIAESSGPIRFYAGMRSDPFFFNSDWATAASSKGKILKPDNSDVMKYTNILSLAFELDLTKLFKQKTTLLALAAESIASEEKRQLDMVGRPEITNVSLVAHKKETDLRDLYNLEPAFSPSPLSQQNTRERLAKNIHYYDALDGTKNWQEKETQELARILADDFLLVDITKPCDGDGFFEIEKSLLRHKAHGSCGGRKPSDDIMDTLFSLYIAGVNGQRIRDGVDKPSTEISSEFPYLAEPDLSPWARTRAYLARKLLGLPH
jgi:hypothetical protein